MVETRDTAVQRCLPRSRARTANVEAVARRQGQALRTEARRYAYDHWSDCDLVQDALERALRSAPDLPCQELYRWLIAVMRNLGIDAHRRQKVRRRAFAMLAAMDESFAADQSDAPSPDASLTPDQLRLAVAQLEPEFRLVLQLHLRRVSVAEIAAQLGIPSATAGTRLFRARAKLRVILSTWSPPCP